ncbi:MAG: Panacea domain-containing protein, partial [Candidatus Acidiferrales bacterium]
MTGDRLVSMPHGPVLSRIYDGTKWGPGLAQAWDEYLAERQGHDVSLRQADPPTDELSEFERGILEETHNEYGHFGPWQLREITHQLPEYRDPRGSSLPIDPATVLRAEGWSDEEIQEALMSA